MNLAELQREYAISPASTRARYVALSLRTTWYTSPTKETIDADLRLLEQVIVDREIITAGIQTLLPGDERDTLVALQAAVLDTMATSDDPVQFWDQDDRFKSIYPVDLLAPLTHYVSDITPLARKSLFEQALTVILARDLVADLLKKTFAQIKDTMVDAMLRQVGYRRLLGTAPSPRARAGIVLADLTIVAASKALTQRQRLDLVTSIQAQANHLISAVRLALEVNPGDSDPMWVDDRALPGQDLLNLLLPGITQSNAATKRRALRAKVGVPVDPSLRSKKRAYAIRDNRLRFMDKVLADLTRHREVATAPDIASQMTQIIDGQRAELTELRQSVLNLKTDLVTAQAEVSRLSQAIDPQDQEAVEKNVSQLVAATSEAITPKAPVKQAEEKPPLTPAESELIIPIPSHPWLPQAHNINITALFESDFHDFRRTGIAMPLSLFRHPSKVSSDLLSYIFLANIDNTPITNPNGIPIGDGHGEFPSDFYNHFMLQSVVETHADKYQVSDTLGRGWVAFAFGKQPQVWQLQGRLINDMYSDQLSRFRSFYDRNLRISKLAETNRRMAISIKAVGLAIYGYGLNLQLATDANEDETLATFTLTMLVSKWTTMPLIKFVNGDPGTVTIPRELTTKSGVLATWIGNANERKEELTKLKSANDLLIDKRGVAVPVFPPPNKKGNPTDDEKILLLRLSR